MAGLPSCNPALLWPGIIAGFMLAFVISLDDVVITEFVKSAGQDTLPTYMSVSCGAAHTGNQCDLDAFFLLSVVIVTLFFFLNRRER